MVPQRPLAEERLGEQGFNLRGFLQLAGRKSQVKQSSEQSQPFGTAKACAGSGQRARLSDKFQALPELHCQAQPGHGGIVTVLPPVPGASPAGVPPAGHGTAAGCESTH